MRDSEDDILNEVSGKAVVGAGAFLQPSAFGKTRLQLTKTRLIERTKFLVSETYSELLLTDLQGAAVVTRGNPGLLALGFMLTAMSAGLAAIMGPMVVIVAILVLIGGFVLYFIFKRRFLVIHAHVYGMHIYIKGNPDRFYDFMDDVLAQAEKAKAAGKGSVTVSTGGGEKAASSRPSSSPAITGDSGPSRPSSGGGVVTCPSCGMEYSLPPGSAGKKFRCTQCKGVIEAPK